MIPQGLTAILFDAGGTLVFPGFRRIADEIAASGIRTDPDALARADALVRFEMDRQDLIASTADGDRFRYYVDALARATGLGRLPLGAMERLETFHNAHNLWEDVPPDVPRALEALRGRFRMGVVSNANGTVRAHFIRLGLARFFETIVDSHEEGFEKPDPRLFRVALERMNLAAPETAYVGDVYHIDILGASAAGLRPVLLDPLDLYADRAVNRIRSLGDLATELLR